jgi:flavin-binding protein dodecin
MHSERGSIGIPREVQFRRCNKNILAENKMSSHVYKVIEIVGSSEKSIDDAITTAVAEANKTVRNMDWFEVVQTRGHITDGKIGHYQVTLKIGFKLETQSAK